MKNTILGILGGLMVLAPGTARSDEMDRFAVELVPGASFATEDLADADLGTGLGADLTVGVRFLPHLWAYGGWGWRKFTADMSFAGPDIDAEETGYSLGIRFEHPFRGPASPSFMVRAGATYTHIEIENASGTPMMDSGHGLGWEAATGVAASCADPPHRSSLLPQGAPIQASSCTDESWFRPSPPVPPAPATASRRGRDRDHG